MQRQPVLLVAITLVACWACDLGVFKDSSSLSFAIREGYLVDPPPPPPHIAFIVTTATEYPCANYRLESELNVSGNLLQVNVSGRVIEPEVA